MAGAAVSDNCERHGMWWSRVRRQKQQGDCVELLTAPAESLSKEAQFKKHKFQRLSHLDLFCFLLLNILHLSVPLLLSLFLLLPQFSIFPPLYLPLQNQELDFLSKAAPPVGSFKNAMFMHSKNLQTPHMSMKTIVT